MLGKAAPWGFLGHRLSRGHEALQGCCLRGVASELAESGCRKLLPPHSVVHAHGRNTSLIRRQPKTIRGPDIDQHHTAPSPEESISQQCRHRLCSDAPQFTLHFAKTFLNRHQNTWLPRVMVVDQNLRHGLWIDHTSSFWNCWHYSTTEGWATLQTAALTGCITLSMPFLGTLLLRFLRWLQSFYQWLKGWWSGRQEGQIRLDNSPPPDASAAPVDPKKSMSKSFGKALLCVVLAAGFVAGVFAPGINSSSAAPSASNVCGIYQFDASMGRKAVARDYVRTYKREERAGQYAEECYPPPNYGDMNLDMTMGCNMLYNRTIAFSRQSGQPCPFNSKDMCPQEHGAVAFDTGFVPVATLGINTNKHYGLRRRAQCSPVNMSDRYIRKRGTGDKSAYFYEYGATSDSDHRHNNYTFKTEGNPMAGKMPEYSADTYFHTTLDPTRNYWTPITALMPPKGSLITIIFIQSHHLFHWEQVRDPIFEATARYQAPNHDDWFYNANPRARPMACIDTIELCYRDTNTCWSMRDPLPKHVPDTPAYWLMKWSMENTFTYQSLEHRLGAALLAQKRIAGYHSAPLNENHWEEECYNLFATSLARIQWDAWSIALGEGEGWLNYYDATESETKGKLCGLFMLKKVGHVNVNWVALVGSLIGAIMVWILALPAPDCMTAWLGTENEYSTPGNLDRDKDDRYLVAEVILRCLTDLLPRILTLAIQLFGLAKKACADGLNKLRDRLRNHFRSTQVIN